MLKKLFVFAVVSLFLAGCATAPLPDRGSRVPPQSRVEPPMPSSGRYQPPEIIAYREPVTPSHARPAPGRAVRALMARAAQQEQAGELVAAAGSLERALRIEPKNPELWNRLAHVRYKQKRYSLAASLAAKSNSFAGQDPALRADNDALIGRARY
ncbi:tetratricopeptide repeat protein [Thiolapillus sp.]